MENINVRIDLSSARNQEGYTALEALRDKLETQRTTEENGMRTVDISDRFTGFPPEAVECLAILSASSQSSSVAHRRRLTFGCTCGECLEGFISPRMKAGLLFQAEVSFDMLDTDIEDGVMWCEMNDDMIAHVHSDMQRNFRTNKSYRQGFTNIFGFVAACLRSDIVPREENVVRAYLNAGNEWPPVTRNYFERGGTMDGKIEPVLRIIFDNARDQGHLSGDGEFERAMADTISNLKTCRNDREFGFVALACGLASRD